jgi:DNA-binding response OmpR family regulator
VFSSNQLVILCIDDEPNILMLRQLLLSIAGYNVLTALDAESGLEVFAGNKIDLVIADQLLPGLSGTEIAREMKRIKPDVPIIIFTGLSELPGGLDHIAQVLTKGMTPPEFLNAIAKVLADHAPSQKSSVASSSGD